MAQLSWFSKLYWRHLASPKGDRSLHRILLERQFTSVLEIGIGSGARTERVLKLLNSSSSSATIRYTVVDAFESAPNHLTLKQAHKMLAEAGVKSSLVPGDLTAALARVGNTIGQHDLIIAEGLLDLSEPQNSLLTPWLKKVANPDGVIATSKMPGGSLQIIETKSLQSSANRVAA